MVEFASNGKTASGYLALPEEPAPGVLVIQEWWGLVPHIKDVADRLAGAGFAALAPDLYHGEETAEPDEAGKLMMALQLDRAARDMSGAVDFLLGHPGVRGDGVGVMGFCMGGGLALWLATTKPEVHAAVPFYGGLWEGVEPDFTATRAAFLGHYAEDDEWATPAMAADLQQRLRGLGRDATFHVYPGTAHAFFNDTRDIYDAAAAQLAWERTTAFLSAQLV
jgi:carboxymethylenebutenolidase